MFVILPKFTDVFLFGMGKVRCVCEALHTSMTAVTLLVFNLEQFTS